VLSGRYTQVVDADPVPVDADCLNCGAAVAVQFEDGVVRVGCDDCDFDVTELDLPAGALADYDRPDVPAVVARWLGRARRTLDDGFCPTCDGRLDNRVRFSTHDDAPEWLREDEVAVRHDCGRCEFRAYSSVQGMVLAHPAVVSFHWERGIDLRETPDWDLEWLGLGTTVESTSPVRLAVPVELDDERREFVFDAALDLVEERP